MTPRKCVERRKTIDDDDVTMQKMNVLELQEDMKGQMEKSIQHPNPIQPAMFSFVESRES